MKMWVTYGTDSWMVDDGWERGFAIDTNYTVVKTTKSAVWVVASPGSKPVRYDRTSKHLAFHDSLQEAISWLQLRSETRIEELEGVIANHRRALEALAKMAKGDEE